MPFKAKIKCFGNGGGRTELIYYLLANDKSLDFIIYMKIK